MDGGADREDPAFIMYLDVALTAPMTDRQRLWRDKEGLGKLCDHGCVNIVLIESVKRIGKLFGP